eukprot:gene20172-24146_t
MTYSNECVDDSLAEFVTAHHTIPVLLQILTDPARAAFLDEPALLQRRQPVLKHPSAPRGASKLVAGSFVAVHRYRSKNVAPYPEEYASDLLDFDKEQFELCYGLVEGLPG